MSRPRFYAVLSMVITLAIPILRAMIRVRLIMTPSYLSFEYNKADFPPDNYGFTTADRLHYAPFAIEYLMSNQEIQYLGDLVQPDGRQFYDERELTHMVDVKKAMQAAFGVLGLVVLLVAIIFTPLSTTYEGRQALRQGIFSGGLLTLIILAGLTIFVVGYWEQFFADFHSLFFSEGTWVFNFSDSLIRLFPVRFWQDAAITIGIMSGVSALAIMGLAWLWARRDQQTL
jgi:integral membrane protein (TIGR01906 family)